ncbi:DUF6286 domain-containing protein [Streptomyces sp. SID13726]|uniref:DUF6286 domain-containing protein n=1 Tax=Streptomyces sp. SID13726 TaxID=2706058 RepID=UPI0013B7E830|nr:DUF6286 domain-containing protein [Streptomyces sp. SID13726]NEB05074.1 Asp23/Gls24 family envelope stress response protein [Streptomyces sp. SID13726]
MTAAAQRGTTTVSERAVRRIAERAATEALPNEGGVRAAGAAASVRGTRAEVSLGVTLPFPAPLADSVRNVHQHVSERTRRLSGLEVSVARVAVTAFAPPVPVRVPEAGEGVEDVPGLRTPRRLWSRRRVPVALVTWAAAVGCGALVLDLARVHFADRTPGVWRTWAVHWLSGHGPGDPAVVAAGGLTALAGLWMVVLALTPGHRRQYTVRGPGPRIDTVVERSTVAVLIRDAVTGVDGVTGVRTRVRGRRVAVRAALAFGDRAAAHTAVTAAARDALAACRLRRDLRLRVTVTPEPLWRPATEPATPVAVPDAVVGGDL